MKNVTSLLKTHPARTALIVALVAIAVFAGVRYVGGSGNPAQGAPQGTQVAASTAVTTANAASTNAVAASTKTGTASGGSCCNRTSGGSASGASGASGGSCCGTGGARGTGSGSSAPTQGAAQVTGSVQKISVDLSTGVYKPDVINLKAGVPAEITFGQSSGCTAIVQSQDLGFQADLSGGPQTVKLPALQPGTYAFACGMNMVRGEVVVK